MGALTLAGERRAPPPVVAAPQAQLPWSRNARGMWRGGCHTLRHLHVVHANHGDEKEMNCDQLTAPTWRAKCHGVATTAEWQNTPA